jgi:bacillithiol system protein YtxJ
MSRSGPTRIRDTDGLAALLDEPIAVLYKHSPACGLSTMAERQVHTFMEANPDVPVYQVDVIRDRGVSREVESRLSTRHESPQTIVLRCGEVVWTGSHGAITAEALARQID